MARPEFYISNKEYEVVSLLQEGKNQTEIAVELHISKSAVTMRLRNMRERYQHAKEFVSAVEKEASKIPNRYF